MIRAFFENISEKRWRERNSTLPPVIDWATGRNARYSTLLRGVPATARATKFDFGNDENTGERGRWLGKIAPDFYDGRKGTQKIPGRYHSLEIWPTGGCARGPLTARLSGTVKAFYALPGRKKSCSSLQGLSPDVKVSLAAAGTQFFPNHSVVGVAGKPDPVRAS